MQEVTIINPEAGRKMNLHVKLVSARRNQEQIGTVSPFSRCWYWSCTWFHDALIVVCAHSPWYPSIFSLPLLLTSIWQFECLPFWNIHSDVGLIFNKFVYCIFLLFSSWFIFNSRVVIDYWGFPYGKINIVRNYSGSMISNFK